MIRQIVDHALNNKFLVLAVGLFLLVWGAIAFHNLPIEAYPDVANNWVVVIAQWPGRAAEEVEQQITIPIETQMNGIAHLSSMRSTTLFGLSAVTLIFDDDSVNLVNRQQTLEKLAQVTLPANVNPVLGADYSPVGQIYFFTLQSTNPEYDLMQLKSIEDWVVEKQLKSVPNVVDVSSFGGTTREYQVQVDPNKLISYGLSLAQVEQALINNNGNSGGSFIESGPQQVNVRAVGLVDNAGDISNTLLKVQNGTPVRVSDIGNVVQGPKIRLGQLGKAIHHEAGRVIDRPDVVEGVVLLRKGAEGEATLELLHAKIAEMNTRILPAGVTIVPHLDRSDLVHYTTHTVLKNLSEGILLVVILLFFFLGNLRSALIVALTIPFSLLFASILLGLNNIPANLLSLGALDFGMVVDGCVVMIENILRHIGRDDDALPIQAKIARAAHEVQRPVFFAGAIIIVAYLPIFTLQRVEGRLFRPMALTVVFALVGARIFSMVLAPVLASLFFRRTTHEWKNPVLHFVTRIYYSSLSWTLKRPYVPILGASLLLASSLYLFISGRIGSEFLPHLDEGAIWARGTLAPSMGPTGGEQIMREARLIFARFPEVTQVVSQIGRPDDGTDTTGFFNTEYFVDLKPHEEWRPQFQSKEQLIDAMDKEVEKIPGVLWNFSQPISDNVEEAVSGVKGELAVKIYGDDLRKLEDTADQIANVMRKIHGIQDLGVFRVVGQPNLNIVVDRASANRFGINVADVQDAVETAIGGKPVTQVLQGEQRYDLVVRYQPQYRATIEQIKDIRMLAPSGERVSLGQLCRVEVLDGASMIYREGNSRYVALKYSVRGRDLGSTVEEAIANVGKEVKLPRGYHLDWAGEYESAKRANKRLAIIVPITVIAIFLILQIAFSSFKWASLILVTMLTAPVGGLYALYFTGTHFSVSSGIGFLALFGVSVQTGVIMIEYINQLRARGHNVLNAVSEGALRRLRPIMMTMLVATLGLLPAALSHGIGSDSQRPFAIVIVGGLSATLAMSVYLLPSLYVLIARNDDVLPASEHSTDTE